MENIGATCSAIGSTLATYSGDSGSSLGRVGRDADFDLQYVAPSTY